MWTLASEGFVEPTTFAAKPTGVHRNVRCVRSPVQMLKKKKMTDCKCNNVRARQSRVCIIVQYIF